MPEKKIGKYPAELGAVESLRELAAGRLSPPELLEASLDKLDQRNGALRAIVAQADRKALFDAARAAGKRYRQGAPCGPLDGLPVTVKDNLWASGMPATWGLTALKDFRPEDEPAVARVREAGALIIGKTNTPEFALAAVTGNGLFGTTVHPDDAALTPGGSSGGAAASVAAGVTALALATDAGGSIRRPAAYTGTVGFKPSAQAVEPSGGFARTALDFQVVGPIARSVEDCALLTSTIALEPGLAALGQDVSSLADTLARWSSEKRARILLLEPADCQEPEITAAMHASADKLARLGHHVQEAPAPYELAEVEEIWSTLIACGVAGVVEQMQLDLANLGAPMRALAQRGGGMAGVQMYRAAQLLLACRQRAARMWQDTDVILSPASPCFAWPHESAYPQAIAGRQAGPRAAACYATFANAVGAPSISLPFPSAPPRHIGIQLTAAPGADARLLAWAWELEQALAG